MKPKFSLEAHFPRGRIVYCTDFEKSNRLKVGAQFFDKYGVVNQYMEKVKAYHVGFKNRQHQIVAAENCLPGTNFRPGDLVRVGHNTGIVASAYLHEVMGLQYVVRIDKIGIAYFVEAALAHVDYRTEKTRKLKSMVLNLGKVLLETASF